jgi:hypothetical protein
LFQFKTKNIQISDLRNQTIQNCLFALKNPKPKKIQILNLKQNPQKDQLFCLKTCLVPQKCLSKLEKKILFKI